MERKNQEETTGRQKEKWKELKKQREKERNKEITKATRMTLFFPQ